MKKLLSFYLLVSMGLSQNAEGQTDAQVASASFGGSGLSAMEMQVLYTRFFEQLTAASDNPLMDSESVNEQVDNECLKKECLQAGLDALGVQQLITGTLKFSKNKYRVKVRRMDASKSRPKKYSIRYRGEPDGFITELEILAWEIMGKDAPESLTGKRKPNQETLVEKIVENPLFGRAVVLAVAGAAGSSYLKNANGASESQKRIDALPSYDTAGIKAHTDSRDAAKQKATLSLVAALGAVAYGYFTGVFSDDEF